MQQTSNAFLEQAHEALGDRTLQETLSTLANWTPVKIGQAKQAFPGFDALRDHVSHVRDHALQHLDHYLERYVEEAEANGSRVHFASSAEVMNQIVLDICRAKQAQAVVKGKSMITEETGLNSELQRAGLTVMETDLGEYIVQQAGETPGHIVGPALHKSVEEIRELFLARHDLGERDLETPAEMVAEARAVLRQQFLGAEVGIIGANALIAENGYSMLVTNEGNGDLCANLPPTLIVCTSVDRILPRATDAMNALRLLVRSTTGQPVTCYTSFYGGPRREGDADGPVETHVILLDNRRTELLASDYREMLKCLRCGTCLNHCPVYTATGGHAYGWVYPGPMGSVLTPLLTSLEDSADLPAACTTCGRCAEVCPADIPLPDLLRDLRHETLERGITPARWRRGMRLHARLLRMPRSYRFLTGVAMKLLATAGRRRGVLSRLPFAEGWLSARELPVPEGETFMARYRKASGNGR